MVFVFILVGVCLGCGFKLKRSRMAREDTALFSVFEELMRSDRDLI